MKVHELMTADVKSCRPETNLAEAVEGLWAGDCGALPVVNDEGRVVGIITDRDICIALATRGRVADRVAVREVAEEHVVTCLKNDEATVALAAMKKHKVRRLPVVDADGHLRGMVSLNDIVIHAGAATPRDVVDAMASICEHRHPTLVAPS